MIHGQRGLGYRAKLFNGSILILQESQAGRCILGGGVFQSTVDEGLLLLGKAKHLGVVHMAKACAGGSQLAAGILQLVVLKVDHGNILAQQLNGLGNDLLPGIHIFHAQQVHRIEEDLQIMVVQCAAAIPGKMNGIDTHWIWQEGRNRLTKEPMQIVDGCIDLPKKGGLGIEVDREQVMKAHKLYMDNCLGARNDAIGMQYLIPDWEFNHKKPCLVR